MELIATIILIGSIFGMGVILFRKIPLLLTLPEVAKEKESLVLKLKRKFKELNPFKNFSSEIFLQKVLTKIRILALKTDTKTFNWLQKLREGYQKKIEERDNYWGKIKMAIKEKKSKKEEKK